MTTFSDQMKKNGLVNLGQVFNQAELEELRAECRDLFEKLPRDLSKNQPNHAANYFGPVLVGNKNQIIVNLLGRSERLDQLLAKLFEDQKLVRTLEEVIGPEYQMWQLTVRESLPGDEGLGLHQDADGETGISVLLSDVPNLDGTTVFIPGTHESPIRLRNTGFNYMGTPKLKKLLVGAEGKAGDVFLFFNRTWHGRFPNQTQEKRMSIIISVFPSGYKLERLPVPPNLVHNLPKSLTSRFECHIMGTDPIISNRTSLSNSPKLRYIDLITRPRSVLFSRWMPVAVLGLLARLFKGVYRAAKPVFLKTASPKI